MHAFLILSDNYHCPRSSSWSFLELQTDGVSAPLCYSVGEAMSFEDALTHCHVHHARVFSLSESYQSYVTPSGHLLMDQLARNGKIW